MKKQNNLKNRTLYQIISLILYFSLYILISKEFKGLYSAFIGSLFLISAFLADIFLSRKGIRIYIRFLIVIIGYILLKLLVSLFSLFLSPNETYLIIIDKLPYLFNRDTIIALLFIIFYFLFDASRIKKVSNWGYAISTMAIILVFFLSLRFDIPITKTIFANYFNLAMFLIGIIVLLIIRHLLFHQDSMKRKTNLKDLLMLIPILLFIILLFFTIILPEHIQETGGKNSGLISPNLFLFDFSNFIELKDEIKLSNERVLIMELHGFEDSLNNRISEGWNRQVYLKRFSLEEYSSGGNFKMSEKFTDPYSPPVYISGYKWELKEKPILFQRIDIKETLYLINIDPSSLMGSDLMTKVAPIINWPDSPYKQIYRSYCNISDSSLRDLVPFDLNQESFLNDLHSSRKRILLEWGDGKKEKRIKELAIEVTEPYPEPFYKVLAVQEHLRRNYYYSLRPGLSKTGDQLEHFLFEAKKGYCSYFAFAMTIMLRSLGIASRVAVGFAPDMNNKTLNFYDVRSLDAHAWVEVYFDDFGWLTFDPTSSVIAPGEEYDFDLGNKEERDDLVEQILKNKDKLEEITKEKEKLSAVEELTQYLKRSIRVIGLFSFILMISSLFIIIYIKKNIYLFLYFLSNYPRKKVIYLYKNVLGKLLDLGYSISDGESILEYAKRLKREKVIDITGITKTYQIAIFREKSYLDISKEEIKTYKKELTSNLRNFDIKKRTKAFFNIRRLWKNILPLLFIILFSLNSSDLYSEDFTTLEEYIIESRQMIESGYYDRALDVLKTAEEKYPYSYKPNFHKGRLFYHHDLFENAIIELQKAKEKGYINEEIYQYIANSYGSIGEDLKAVKTYEEAFDTLYPSMNLYDKLGWMYFKVHDIKKGVEMVNDGLEKYPTSSDLYMTLGTFYSALRDYERSKEYYLNSLEYSYTDFNTNDFRAIAYYNLSLLEQSFLYYDNAFASAKASLSLKNRSSAHLELNYLYVSALDLKNAYREVIEASGLLPTTLFPEMALIYIYILSGRIDEAIKLDKDLLENTDFSWMLYFGTNKDDYYSELYRELSICYDFKADQIKYNDKWDILSNFLRPFKVLYYNILSMFYNFRFTNLYTKIGEEKIKGGSNLEGLYELYDGYEKIWPSKAKKILKLIENIEIKNNPQKKKIYDIKKAILNKKTSLFYSKKKLIDELEKNIELLDKKWEKEIETEALIELIKASKNEVKDKYINKLFEILPSMLPMNGIRTNAEIYFVKDNFPLKLQNKLLKSLQKRGLNNILESRFNIEIGKITNNIIFVNLYDVDNIKRSFNIEMTDLTVNDAEKISLEIFNKLFILELY